jgi:hypothetical protein
MGFQQSIVVSSLLDKASVARTAREALARWPFLRLPRDASPRPGHLLLALPEMTEYLFEDEAAYEKAVDAFWQVEEQLASWSEGSPGISLAFIEADCLGGTCIYDGFVCQGGTVLERVENEKDGHVRLLRRVGIEIDGTFFLPFTRGFFAGRSSGSRT